MCVNALVPIRWILMSVHRNKPKMIVGVEPCSSTYHWVDGVAQSVGYGKVDDKLGFAPRRVGNVFDIVTRQIVRVAEGVESGAGTNNAMYGVANGINKQCICKCINNIVAQLRRIHVHAHGERVGIIVAVRDGVALATCPIAEIPQNRIVDKIDVASKMYIAPHVKSVLHRGVFYRRAVDKHVVKAVHCRTYGVGIRHRCAEPINESAEIGPAEPVCRP